MIIIVLLILHVAFVYDSSDDADHIPEERSAAELDDHNDDDFCIVLRGDVSEANCYGRCHRPVDRVDVLDH